MNHRLRLSALSEEGVTAIHQASLQILHDTGVSVEHPRAREILHGAGATVVDDRVSIPAPLVERALETHPGQVSVYNRDGEPHLLLDGKRSYFWGIASDLYILDPFSRTIRDFTSADYSLTAKLVDACPHLFGADAGGPTDYPLGVRRQVGYARGLLNMRKPLLVAPGDRQQLADILEVAAVVAGDAAQLRQAPFILIAAMPTTPLGLFRGPTESLLESARRGLPVVWYPAASAGTTAPCSPAGLLALTNAEVLAGLTLHQSVRPGAPFVYGAMPSVTDMRTLQYSYGSPDFALHLAAATDMAHSYGLPMFSTAGCSDALSVDLQAAVEATLLCWMAQLSGADLIHDVGLLAGSLVVSPEMMVLCDEIIGMVTHAGRGVDTGPGELPLDLIDRVGPGGHFITTDHTLANFRRFWHSDVFLREGLSGLGCEDPDRVRDRINSKTRTIVESHQVEPLADEVLQELEHLEEKWLARIEG